MAMTVGNLRVYLTLDSSGYVKGLAEAERSGSAAQRSLGNIGSVASGIGSMLGDVAKGVSVAFTAATAATGAYMVSASKSYVQAAQFENAMELVGKAVGVSNETIQEQVTQITRLGGSQKTARELTMSFMRAGMDAAEAWKLYERAEDIAVTTGRTGNEVIQSLIHGIQTQNVQVLRNVDVTIDGQKALDDYAKSMGKTRDQLTGTERQQAYYNAVMRETNYLQGVSQAMLKDLPFNWKALEAPMQNLSETMGKLVEPAVSEVGRGIFNLVTAFTTATQKGGALHPVIEQIRGVFASMQPFIKGVFDTLIAWLNSLNTEKVKGFLEALAPLAPVLGALAGAMLVLGSNVAVGLLGPLGKLLGPLATMNPVVAALVGGIGALVAISPELRGMFGEVAKQVGGVVNSLGDQFKPILDALAPRLRDFAKAALEAAPALTKIAGTLGVAVASLLPGVIQLGTWLLQAVAPALRLMADHSGVIVPILISMAAAVGAIVGVLKIYQAVTTAMTVVQGLFNLVMMANPITLVALALVGLVAGLIIAYNTFEPFRNLVNALWDGVKGLAGAIWDGLVVAFNAVKDAVEAVIKWFQDWWDVLIWISPGLALIVKNWDAIKDALLRFKDALGDVFGAVWDFVQQVVGFFQWLWEQLVGGSIIPDLVNGILALFNWLGEAIMTPVNAIRDAVVGAWTWITDTVTALVQGLWDAVTGIMSAVGQWLFDSHEQWKALVGAAWTWIRDTVGSLAGSIWETVTSWLSSLWSWIQQHLSDLGGLFERSWSWIRDTVSGLAGQLWEAVKGAVWAFVVWAADRMNEHAAFLNNLWTWVRDTISNLARQLWDAVTTRIWEFVLWVVDRMNDYNAFMTSIWTTIKDTVASLVQQLWDWVTNRLSEFFWWAYERFQEHNQFMQSIWDQIRSNTIDRVTALYNGVVDWFTGMKERVEGLLTALRDSAGNIVKDMANWIIDHLNNVISKLNEFIDKVREGLGQFGVTIPGDWKVPGPIGKFARGGVVERPTFLMAGEEGKESIIPWAAHRRPEAERLWKQIGAALGFFGAMGGPGGSLGEWWRGSFPMTQGPGGAFSHGNLKAWDYAMPNGTQIIMGLPGTVVPGPGGGYGTSVGVNLDSGGSIVMAHLTPGSVKTGRMNLGEQIALSDNTGFSTGPHMHFEVRDSSLSPGAGDGGGGGFDLLGMIKGWAEAIVGPLEDGLPPMLKGAGRKLIIDLSVPALWEWVKKNAKSLIDNAVSFVSELWNGNGEFKSWAEQAMSMAGVGQDWLQGLDIIAKHESNYNPNSRQQVYDINTAQGDPAAGIMQIIGKTFAAYAQPGMNRMNPVDSIYTAIKYIQARYGHVNNVPGVKAVLSGGRYVGYDAGGVLQPGLTLAANRTGRGEVVLNGATFSRLLSVLDRLDGALNRGGAGVNVTNNYQGTGVTSQEVVSDLLIALRTL